MPILRQKKNNQKVDNQTVETKTKDKSTVEPLSISKVSELFDNEVSRLQSEYNVRLQAEQDLMGKLMLKTKDTITRLEHEKEMLQQPIIQTTTTENQTKSADIVKQIDENNSKIEAYVKEKRNSTVFDRLHKGLSSQQTKKK